MTAPRRPEGSGVNAAPRGGWEPCEGRCGHRVLATHGRDETGRRPVLLDNADRDGPVTLAEHTAARCRALREAP
ncbi:MAG: hypothetical protein L0I76_12650 [Pseudonocardia sp.]|nr:hypothetical protein [Pseudonocardia sp.]